MQTEEQKEIVRQIKYHVKELKKLKKLCKVFLIKFPEIKIQFQTFIIILPFIQFGRIGERYICRL